MVDANAELSVSAQALASFRHHEQAIIARVAARSLERRDEVIQHGENAEHLITAGIQFTTRMLDTAMALGEVALLEDQLAWALQRLPHDGVSPQQIVNRLRLYAEVVEELLSSDHARQITPFVAWMVTRLNELLRRE